MPTIDIVRNQNGTVAFDPPVLTRVKVGDHIIWRNLDQKKQHWITRKGERKDLWFPSALAPASPGHTPDTSRPDLVIQRPEDIKNDIEYVSFGEGIEGRITSRLFVS
jgi:hypothetical protein